MEFLKIHHLPEKVFLFCPVLWNMQKIPGICKSLPLQTLTESGNSGKIFLFVEAGQVFALFRKGS